MAEFTAAASFVKICGVTTPRDAVAVADAGADALGVILTSSSRRVDRAQATKIVAAVHGRLVRVGVTRGVTPAEVLALIDGLDVDVVQLHDPLDDALVDALRARGLGVIKALSVGAAELPGFDESAVDAVLVDGPVPGSGRVHSWRDLSERAFLRPVIGAGGLTPENVGTLIDAGVVWGVDVATGVESAPGVKDVARVVDFVQVARAHFARRRRDRG